VDLRFRPRNPGAEAGELNSADLPLAESSSSFEAGRDCTDVLRDALTANATESGEIPSRSRVAASRSLCSASLAALRFFRTCSLCLMQSPQSASAGERRGSGISGASSLLSWRARSALMLATAAHSLSYSHSLQAFCEGDLIGRPLATSGTVRIGDLPEAAAADAADAGEGD
jgi:hypothetical protein